MVRASRQVYAVPPAVTSMADTRLPRPDGWFSRLPGVDHVVGVERYRRDALAHQSLGARAGGSPGHGYCAGVESFGFPRVSGFSETSRNSSMSPMRDEAPS